MNQTDIRVAVSMIESVRLGEVPLGTNNDSDSCSDADIELVFLALTRVVAKLNQHEPNEHLVALLSHAKRIIETRFELELDPPIRIQ